MSDTTRPIDERYDVIVIGVGGMGSATVYQLAARGFDVLGIERFDVPHTMGSSHGSTRIIRLAQHEGPSYVPLAKEAYDYWRELETVTGRDLLVTTGSVHAGGPGTDLIDDVRRACDDHGVDYEALTPAAVNERYPGYDLPPGFDAVYQPDGGYLDCEQCVIAHVQAAHDAGATIRARECVRDWSETGDGVRVRTDKGRYAADELVLTAGAWTADLLPEIAEAAVPVRAVMAWLQPKQPELFVPERFPVFVIRDEDDGGYGFPIHDVPGFKFGRSAADRDAVDPDEMPREPTTADEERHRRFARTYFPAGAGPTLALHPCIQTYSPDEDFLLGRVSGHNAVTIGAGFTGHGFKFTSVIGAALADLATTGHTDHEISPHRIDRIDR